MEKIKIYWAKNDELDALEEMQLVVQFLEQQEIKTFAWDDWYAPGEAWSLEVEKVPLKLPMRFHVIKEDD